MSFILFDDDESALSSVITANGNPGLKGNIYAQELQKMASNPPRTIQEGVIKHAAAFSRYMRDLKTPPVTSYGHDLAQKAFAAVATLQALPVVGVPALILAYKAYLSTMILDPLAAATNPTPPTSLPPVIPLGVVIYADGIDSWIHTGIIKVGGVVAPWV